MQVLHDVRQKAASFQQQSSPDTSTVRTFTPPGNAVACLITVETTDARVSFHGADPSSSVGHVIKVGQNPYYHPAATAFRAASTAGTASVVNVTWLY